VFIFLRAFYQDPKDLSPPVELLERSKIYPLGKKESAKPMVFPDASGVPANMLPVSDGSVFEQLKRLADSEGRHLASPDGLGMLASIGIVKGKPFNPDAHTREILDRAAKTAYKMSRVIGFREEVSGRIFRMYPDRQWLNPFNDATPDKQFAVFEDLTWKRADGGFFDLDSRIWFFTDYYSVSPGMFTQTPGRGAWYAVSFNDADGNPLDGGADYRIILPPDIPAANFWSLTLYEAENASGYANGQPFPSLGSRDEPVQNADGSTIIYLGPKAPAGKEANWLATVPGKGWFALIRLYGPTENALKKIWKPGDFEKVD
jgi:hypothetical protein